MTTKNLDKWLLEKGFQKEIYYRKDTERGDTTAETHTIYIIRKTGKLIRLDHTVTVCRNDKRGNVLWTSRYWGVYAHQKDGYSVEVKITRHVPLPEDIELILKLIKI